MITLKSLATSSLAIRVSTFLLVLLNWLLFASAGVHFRLVSSLHVSVASARVHVSSLHFSVSQSAGVHFPACFRCISVLPLQQLTFRLVFLAFQCCKISILAQISSTSVHRRPTPRFKRRSTSLSRKCSCTSRPYRF